MRFLSTEGEFASWFGNVRAGKIPTPGATAAACWRRTTSTKPFSTASARVLASLSDLQPLLTLEALALATSISSSKPPNDPGLAGRPGFLPVGLDGPRRLAKGSDFENSFFFFTLDGFTLTMLTGGPGIPPGGRAPGHPGGGGGPPPVGALPGHGAGGGGGIPGRRVPGIIPGGRVGGIPGGRTSPCCPGLPLGGGGMPCGPGLMGGGGPRFGGLCMGHMCMVTAQPG